MVQCLVTLTDLQSRRAGLSASAELLVRLGCGLLILLKVRPCVWRLDHCCIWPSCSLYILCFRRHFRRCSLEIHGKFCHLDVYKVLDLFYNNKPTSVKAMVTVPDISDHDAIVADCDIKPAFCKKKPRTVFLFSTANWCEMKEDMMKFTSSFLTTYLDNTVENNNWSSFKEHITMLMSSHVLSKTIVRNTMFYQFQNKTGIGTYQNAVKVTYGD